MRKILSVLAVMLAVVCSSAVFVSCSDDEEESFIKNPSFDTNMLFGKWTSNGYCSTKGGGYAWVYSASGTTVKFYQHGKMSTRGIFGNYNDIDYTINGNVINVTMPKGVGGYIRIRVEKITEELAYFKIESAKDNEEESSIYMQFEK